MALILNLAETLFWFSRLGSVFTSNSDVNFVFSSCFRPQNHRRQRDPDPGPHALARDVTLLDF